MKKLLLHKADKLFFAMVVSFSLLVFTVSFGQTRRLSSMTNNKYALQNLEMGIQSLNGSVRKSAIYFAGKYEIIESEDALINQLKYETKAELKALIGLSLFSMKSEKGIKELQNLVSTDMNLKVRRMCHAILNAYLDNKPDNQSNGENQGITCTVLN
jgi:hypothetical protein